MSQKICKMSDYAQERIDLRHKKQAEKMFGKKNKSAVKGFKKILHIIQEKLEGESDGEGKNSRRV